VREQAQCATAVQRSPMKDELAQKTALRRRDVWPPRRAAMPIFARYALMLR